jgi:GTP cyclohydrolase-4
MPLDRVSVFNQKIKVGFIDELFGHVEALFAVRASVRLKGNQRGIHMSRIEASFTDLPDDKSLIAVVKEISERILNTQEQDQALVSIWGDVLLSSTTRVTNLISNNIFNVSARAVVGTHSSYEIGLQATNITACPCMQTYALDEMVKFLELPVEDPNQIIGKIPVATHSQKGRVFIYLSSEQIENIASYTFQDLYATLANGCHLTSELLKRPDEYDLVRRAHIQAQFVEDVVRDVITSFGCQAKKDYPVNVTVKAGSYESIHGHDIDAEATINSKEIV